MKRFLHFELNTGLFLPPQTIHLLPSSILTMSVVAREQFVRFTLSVVRLCKNEGERFT